jgi:origin recognition complex subunit 2
MRLETARFIAESYFDFQGENTTLGVGTSKRLFSKHPHKPSANALTSTLLTAPEVNNETSELHARISKELFPQWRLQMEAGCNLALIGYGSKTKLLDDFIAFLDTWHVFRLRAYSKNASLLSLLNVIIDQLFEGGEGKGRRRLVDAATFIKNHCQSSLVLVIEMADAPCMRMAEVWRSLVILAESPNIRIIATFEHVNSLILNSSQLWPRMNFIWHDATTMRPYSAELATVLMTRGPGGDIDSKWKGAQFVLSSLTLTGRAVYRVLAEYQLQSSNTLTRQNMDSDDDEGEEDEISEVVGLSLVAWYQQCQEQFIVSNEIAFRTQLTEFLDHELVKSVDGSGHNGSEFYIPFDRSQIEALFNICKSN